eukprot:GHVU01015792.1.p3 GENE.GHVU01015792.1~~GHVU01015792.1.p3  ORF type:complete len:144 (-),score=3.29 GHVU01015792.1:1218-1649(-)
MMLMLYANGSKHSDATHEEEKPRNFPLCISTSAYATTFCRCFHLSTPLFCSFPFSPSSLSYFSSVPFYSLPYSSSSLTGFSFGPFPIFSSVTISCASASSRLSQLSISSTHEYQRQSGAGWAGLPSGNDLRSSRLPPYLLAEE